MYFMKLLKIHIYTMQLRGGAAVIYCNIYCHVGLIMIKL